jgi:hypothetical protein
MRQCTVRNVDMADRRAILGAMADDAQRKGKTMADVGQAMLLDLEAWDEVPQDRWQYVPAILKYYNSGDYRHNPRIYPASPTAPKEAQAMANDATLKAMQTFYANHWNGTNPQAAVKTPSRKPRSKSCC